MLTGLPLPQFTFLSLKLLKLANGIWNSGHSLLCIQLVFYVSHDEMSAEENNSVTGHFTGKYIPPTVAPVSIEGWPVFTGCGKLWIEVCCITFEYSWEPMRA